MNDFVPFEKLTAVYPVEYKVSSRYNRQGATVLGIQIETSDMRTAVMQFPEKNMAEEVDEFKKSMASQWLRLYRDDETITGYVSMEGSDEAPYSIVRGSLYWPKAMRDRVREPSEVPNVSGRAPLPRKVQDLMDLDTASMDHKELRQWGVSIGKYLVSTARQPGDEGADDPEWRSQRIALTEEIIQKVEAAEKAKNALFPTAGLYQALGEEFTFDQFTVEMNDRGQPKVVPADVDENRCHRAMGLIDKALRTFPLHWYAFNSKSIVLNLLGEQERSMAYKKAFVNMATLAQRVQVTALAIGNAEIPNFKEAHKHSKKAVKEIPDQSGPWYIHGCVLYSLGKHKKAVKAFDECIRLDPSSVLGWLGKGLVLEAMGDRAGAAECMKRT
jgi:tetratricopeptide (TPR) repeat protein